jgi:hypothetical protein
MDWSTHDYTRTYADTIYVPEQDYGAGVYPLDEAGPDADDAVDSRVRAPIRPYSLSDKYADRGGRYGRAARHPIVGTPFNEYRTREGYYTGGNIVSNRENQRAVFNVAWDERPLHYNPNAGTDWAHLVPPYSARPYGGGPAPSLAFPMITNSEAQVRPKELFAAGAGAGACGHSAELVLQVIKVILLVIIVVMLAMSLSAAGRVSRDIEKTIREALSAARAPASGQ